MGISSITAQKMKFSVKDFFSKCDQIRRKLRIWSHLLKKSLMENFIFCAVYISQYSVLITCHNFDSYLGFSQYITSSNNLQGHRKNSQKIFVRNGISKYLKRIKSQSCHHIKTCQLICSANQLTGF